MIGLVNAAGAYQASRTQSSDSPGTKASTPHDVGEPPMWVRPHEPHHTARETVQGVEAPEFLEADAERATPSGDESDQLKQAELESGSRQDVGAFLDMIA